MIDVVKTVQSLFIAPCWSDTVNEDALALILRWNSHQIQ